MDRQLGARLLAVHRDRMALVIDAEGGEGPAVIAAGTNQVQLIAALRAVLVGPELAGGAIESETLRIAVPITPDLGPGAGRGDEGIVLGHRSVGLDAHDGPGGVGQILRTGPVPAVAERDEQIAVAAQGEAATDLLGPRA